MWKFLSLSNVLIFCGAILAGWANFHFRSRSKQQLRESLVLIGVTVSAGGGLLASCQQAEYQQQIADMTSGGDSFCFGAFMFAADAPSKPDLAIFLRGEYPLQNVHVMVRDYDRLKAALPNMPKGRENARGPTYKEKSAFDSLSESFTIPSLGPPGTALRVGGWELPDNRDALTYSIWFSTPYQEFYQHLKLRKVNGSWIQAYRVHKKDSKGKLIVLLEDVPKEFPREQDGKINWNFF
jgi:hypothetical protein